MDISSSTPVKPHNAPYLNGVKQLNIMPFESDDEAGSEEDVEFSSILKLLQSEIHLAIFINFTLVHSHAEQILFYLITNLYKQGNVDQLKQWSYEIFSSFIADDAPLQIFPPDIQERIATEIDTKLTKAEAFKSDHMEIVKSLREIFNNSRFETMTIINEQLKNFQNKRRAGLDSLYGMSPMKDLKSISMDSEMASKTIEKNLMPKLLVMLEELEECKEENPKLLLLISALSTVVYQTFRPKTSYIEPVSQFVSKSLPLCEFLDVKGHQLTSKNCHSTTYCDYCLQSMFGIGPQGFECACGIRVHKSCISSLKGTCILVIENLTINDTTRSETRDSSKLYELVHSSIGNRRVENYKRSKSNRPKSDPGKILFFKFAQNHFFVL